MRICQKCGTKLTGSLIFCNKCTGESFSFTETVTQIYNPVLELAEKIFLASIKILYTQPIEITTVEAVRNKLENLAHAAIHFSKIFYEEADKQGLIKGGKNENDNG